MNKWKGPQELQSEPDRLAELRRELDRLDKVSNRNFFIFMGFLALYMVGMMAYVLFAAKGLAGVVFLADCITGGCALAAALLASRFTPISKNLAIAAVFFFIAARAGQYTLL